jgi:hypothetical protein
LKNGDVLIVVATMAVIFALIIYPSDLAFTSALGLNNGYLTSGTVCSFVVALVAGIIFAGKIQESRWAAIAKITVVWGVFNYLVVASALFSPTHTTYAMQSYNGQYGSTLSAYQWTLWMGLYADMLSFELVAVFVVTAIVGLYIGSMLRRPKKI